MQQFNYPTTILFGEGALNECAARVKKLGLKHPLLVTDATLVKVGIAEKVKKTFASAGVDCAIFDGVHPNPIEEDVEKGAAAYKKEKCDCVVALGGGSPIDTAKVIMLAATHNEPLATYDASIGGYEKIQNVIPPLFAISTTAGTGSEVGRSGVIIMKKTNNKTTFFSPYFMPKLAVLEPELTRGLPPAVTAATGIDAFTHCLESYFAPGFHPMADGIAFEGLRVILRALPKAVKDGNNLEARGEMLIAASMGAAAFQKDLGMIHSLAHPLSSECGLHHGLANALMLPVCVDFLDKSKLNDDQRTRLTRVQELFVERKIAKASLSASCHDFIAGLGIKFGLRNHAVKESQIDLLSDKAFKDPCHQTNMIPVTREILKRMYQEAF